MSSSVITQSDGSVLKPQTKSWFKRFKPALWLAPFALFFYLFQLAPMVWVLINSPADPQNIGKRKQNLFSNPVNSS